MISGRTSALNMFYTIEIQRGAGYYSGHVTRFGRHSLELRRVGNKIRLKG